MQLFNPFNTLQYDKTIKLGENLLFEALIPSTT